MTQFFVLDKSKSIPIRIGGQETGAGRKRGEAGDKGTGSGRAGYGKREVRTSLPPRPPSPAK